MKYDVIFKCGHAGVLDLVGKSTEWRLEQAQYNLCPDCYRAMKQKEMEEELAKYNLPELSGTERQIKWATEIRFKFASEANRNLNGEYKDNTEFIGKYTKTYKSIVDVQTTSKWWIEHRDEFEGVSKHAQFMNSQYIKIAGIE